MSTPMTMNNCPTDETLAAFIDGRLAPEARRTVMAHIADCADCYALVTAGWDFQAMETSGSEAPAEVVKGRFGTGPWIWTAAAAAAAIVIVVALPVTQERIAFERGRSRLIAAQSAAPTRSIEGRLPGFSYQPYQGPKRGAKEESLDFVELEAEQVKALHARSARELRTQAAAHLVRREYDAAIAVLEHAAKLSPEDAMVQNDLAVAYLTRRQWKGTGAADAQRALQAAERAWQLDQTPETAFNRALVLEHNTRRAEAIQAWQEYLSIDAKSPWAADARTHLYNLQHPL